MTTTPPATVPSPCIGHCRIDEASGYCAGCFRTLEEICNWLSSSDDEKREALRLCEQRRAKDRVCDPARVGGAMPTGRR